MKKNIYFNFFLILSVISVLTSCVSRKQIAYFQKGIGQMDTIAVAEAYIPKIQPADILAINIGSLNPMASSFFNPYSSLPTSPNTDANSVTQIPGSNTSTQNVAPGLLVDPAGNIELPLVGSIKVAGLNTSEARDLIKERLKTYLKEPTVNVRFLNYKISVMGEVARPSVYVIPNEKITLPEALSMAGDLTIFANRGNVLIIRDNDGRKEFGTVNLSTRELYTSPYYYLHTNDVVYVEPGKGKIAQSDKVYQILPVLLSALSFISIIFVYARR
ncbi:MULTISPECIES: polysaccharide biosynthesis/export family protein [unclassified Mucilaginibacter]|uniref:polysaccharide biosynthesis/export family protein n=1 Tax=unclassified Mucilaginibacter TaxID=2617802 RepID=UPI002AC9ADA9|nr:MULTISPECIES: polysaccharide biosynthesis/export family protein [unclassified Mucilaginibacter]MEB0261770.1 polysaccharide biosynthesis/export family protein [Mucilaginibacter sp. 10I4]MEB0277560.1 polysaccharide biosynthesis/export family protein [Mucilaginibacter sp. 10B2]MEB0299475.1 polysaccharide biosynthesis/export family protein [Mucilaginibacter sp. 5C4]WPX24811.1 polysaccharide biosynthesis/export family protein [Mucilaginibacter sp. 5C4]